MVSKHVNRAAEILYKLAKIQKKKLVNAKVESQKFSTKIDQVKNSKQLNQIFDKNAQEILKKIKNSNL